MKAPPFEYEKANSSSHAASLLAAANGEGRVIAGGQTLGPMLNLRLAAPKVIIDIGHLEELKRIEDRTDRLILGATVTHSTLEDRNDPTPLGRLISYAGGSIAHRAIRNRGTIGGSLCHADPAADWVTTMSLLGAEAIVTNETKKRRIPIREFMLTAYTTALEPNEILESVEIPKVSAQARWGYSRITRKVGEFPHALAAVLLDQPRKISRIVVGALSGRPVMLPQLSRGLAAKGPAIADTEIETAVSQAIRDVDTMDLAIHVAAVRRAIRQALSK